MNADSGISIFIGLIGVAVVGRVIADGMDRQRIRADLAGRGCTTIQIRWNPFGPGWFGEKGDRIYSVVYQDESGRRISAACKTSLLSGVYWHNPAESMPAAGSRADKEPVECLACGKPMGKNSKCPACGWSYKA